MFVFLGEFGEEDLEEDEEQGLDETIIRTVWQERWDDLSDADVDGLAEEGVRCRVDIAVVLVGQQRPVLLLREQPHEQVEEGFDRVANSTADDQAQEPPEKTYSLIFIFLWFLLFLPF